MQQHSQHAYISKNQQSCLLFLVFAVLCCSVQLPAVLSSGVQICTQFCLVLFSYMQQTALLCIFVYFCAVLYSVMQLSVVLCRAHEITDFTVTGQTLLWSSVTAA